MTNGGELLDATTSIMLVFVLNGGITAQNGSGMGDNAKMLVKMAQNS